MNLDTWLKKITKLPFPTNRLQKYSKEKIWEKNKKYLDNRASGYRFPFLRENLLWTCGTLRTKVKLKGI